MMYSSFKAIEEVRDLQLQVADVLKIRCALVPNLPEMERGNIYHHDRHESVESFETFCGNLEDDTFQKLVVWSHSLQLSTLF